MQNIVIDLLTWEKILRANAAKTSSVKARENLNEVADQIREIYAALITGIDSYGNRITPEEVGQVLLRLWRKTHQQEWQFSTLPVLGDEANQVSLTLSFLRDTAESLLRQDFVVPQEPLKIEELEKMVNPVGICKECGKVVEQRGGKCPYCKKKTELIKPEDIVHEDKGLGFIPDQEIDFEKLAPSTIFLLNIQTGNYECKRCGFAPFLEGYTKDKKCRDIRECPNCGLKEESLKAGPKVFIAPKTGSLVKQVKKKAKAAKVKDKSYKPPKMLAIPKEKKKPDKVKKEEIKHGIAYTPWPCERGNGGRSSLSKYLGPSSLGKRWTLDIKQSIHTPLILGGNGSIYMGISSGLLQVINGQIGWIFFTRKPMVITPCIDTEGYIYTGTTDKLYKLNPDGSMRWVFREKGLSSVAILTNGAVITASNNKIFCLSPEGQPLWTYTLPSKNTTFTPAVDSYGNMYVSVDKLLGISKEGELFLNIPLEESSIPLTVVDYEGIPHIYVSCGNKLSLYRKDGNKVWDVPLKSKVISPISVTPNKEAIACTSDGTIYAIAYEGRESWRIKMPDISVGAPTVDKEGKVYVSLKNSSLYALKQGKTLFRFSAKALGFIGGGTLLPASPIDESGVLYVATNKGKVYAIG